MLVRGDLRRLEPLRGRVDLALAINSICPPTAAQARRMIAGIAASLRPDGTAILVLPSLDSLAYLHELFRRHHGAPPPGESIEPRAGIYVATTGERQKYFTPEAIAESLAENRLTTERVEKILYPWSLIRRYGWGYFPRHRRLWDGYVTARRG